MPTVWDFLFFAAIDLSISVMLTALTIRYIFQEPL